MNIKEKIGNRLRELRKETGMTIEAAAFKSGYDCKYWGEVELGKRNVSFMVLYDFICTVDSTVSDFFSHEVFNTKKAKPIESDDYYIKNSITKESGVGIFKY